MRCRTLLLSWIVCLAASMSVRADPEVSVVVIGPGHSAWERFGHIGLRVRDESQNLDVWFDWGRFEFGGVGFYWNFARGHMRYWMESGRAAPVIDFYASLGRDVIEYEIELSPDQTARLIDDLLEADTDENRFYDYGYYTNNCSTAIRDVLDRVAGGAIREQLQGKMTDETFRSVTRRLMYDDLPNTLQMLGADFVNGRRVDRPLDAWEASFTPMEFARQLGHVRVPDDAGQDVRLVREARTIHRATDPRLIETDEQPDAMRLWLTIPGLLVGAAVVFARRSRKLSLLLVGLASLLIGVAGCVLVFMAFFTVHYATWPNENLLLATPLSLLVVLGAVWPRLRTVALLAAVVSLVLALAAALLKLDPESQRNAPWIGLFLPIHVASVLALIGARRTGSSAGEPSPEAPCPSPAAPPSPA